MPSLGGRFVPVLSVSNVEASADWYARVLGLVEASRYVTADSALLQVVLVDPASDLTLCLVAARTDGAFDEHRLGLDHLELLVTDRAELDRWVRHLDATQVPCSEVKEPSYSDAAIVTFRDPDNIQLELYCPTR